MRFDRTFALLAAATILSSPALAAAQSAPQAAPIASLVKEVSLPAYEFKLKNGLTVMVHEDHKAPVVGFGVWYNVGSKDEPEGKTGFAHLFEHLMFYGSDNVREASAVPREYRRDRLERDDLVRPHQLFRDGAKAEARAGAVHGKRPHGLSARRDRPEAARYAARRRPEREARGRQPARAGCVEYAQLENLFPAGHPYHHSTIGSMADLDAASLAT